MKSKTRTVKPKKRVVKAWALVNRHNDELMEVYLHRKPHRCQVMNPQQYDIFQIRSVCITPLIPKRKA